MLIFCENVNICFAKFRREIWKRIFFCLNSTCSAFLFSGSLSLLEIYFWFGWEEGGRCVKWLLRRAIHSFVFDNLHSDGKTARVSFPGGGGEQGDKICFEPVLLLQDWRVTELADFLAQTLFRGFSQLLEDFVRHELTKYIYICTHVLYCSSNKTKYFSVKTVSNFVDGCVQYF